MFYAVYLKAGRLHEVPRDMLNDALHLLRETDCKAEFSGQVILLAVRDEDDYKIWSDTPFSMAELRGRYPSGKEEQSG